MTSDRLVVIVVFDDMELLDAVGPAEVFSAATRVNRGGYRTVIASAGGADVRSGSGISLQVDTALGDITEQVDTLLVAGGINAHRVAQTNEKLVDDVRTMAERANRFGSVCTGSFILAAAGLLSGRTVTTHWAACVDLRSACPDVIVEPNRIFVRDGTLYTSGGVTAGMDLALAMVEIDHGANLARTVAKHLVLYLQRPGGQSQFSNLLAHPITTESPLRPVVDAVIAAPAENHSLPQMARRAAVSDRHLRRLFVEQTGKTPARFVESVRVEAAQRLLETSDLGIAAIAKRCGLGSADSLRRSFDRVLGVSPGAYRDRFHANSG